VGQRKKEKPMTQKPGDRTGCYPVFISAEHSVRTRNTTPKTQKAPKRLLRISLFQNFMAGTTRLELATSAVTGQRSNQLNYVPAEGFQQLTSNSTVRVSRCVTFCVSFGLRKINLAASFNQPRSFHDVGFIGDVLTVKDRIGLVT
jgi:hypothetical protein